MSAPDDLRSELAELARQARAWVEWVADSGVDELPRATEAPSAARQPVVEQPPVTAPSEDASPATQPPVAVAPRPPKQARAVTPKPAAPRRAAPSIDVPDTPAARAARLAELADEVSGCTKCGLHETRQNTVFGRGSPAAKLVFVSEGPGANEDAQGVPFVGKAGQLLDRMIAAMGYQRDEVYICNVVKCRPPRNRKPEPDEMAACLPYLHEQLALLEPQVIVCLGATGVEGLLGSSMGITRMRGTWKLYRGRIPLMPTFHPAYLLRQPEKKREVWDDLQQVMKRLGMDPKAKSQRSGEDGD